MNDCSTEPIYCPHCNQVVPEPNFDHSVSAAELLRRRYPRAPEVRYDWVSQSVDIFGGDSTYTKEDPYSIGRDRLATAEKALSMFAHVASKRWAHGESFLHALARAYVDAIADNGSGQFH